MIPGIDVSVWQDDNSTPQKMNFKKAAAKGAKYVFIKASERGGIDQDFIDNWANAKSAGLLRGAYHFLRWDLPSITQARIFCDVIKDDPGELPPVADFEAPIKDGKYPSNSILASFLETVESLSGKKPMIYTSPGFWTVYGKIKGTAQYDPKWAYYPLWVAHYTKAEQPQALEPWKSAGKTWTFWQHGVYKVGLEYGAESEYLDMNWFNGSMVDLLKFAGITGEGPTLPPGTTINIQELKYKVNEAIDSWAKEL